MKRDIETRVDLFMLLKKFYEKLLNDETISYIFTDVAKLDMQQHLPVIVDFWDMVLFGSPTYKNAMQPHMVFESEVKVWEASFWYMVKIFWWNSWGIIWGWYCFNSKAESKKYCHNYANKNCTGLKYFFNPGEKHKKYVECFKEELEALQIFGFFLASLRLIDE